MKWEWNAEDLLVKFLWKGKYFHGNSWNIFQWSTVNIKFTN